MKDSIIGYNRNDFYYMNATDIYEKDGTLTYSDNISCTSPSYEVNDNICANLSIDDNNSTEKMINCYVGEVCKNKEKSLELQTFLPDNISSSNEKYKNSKSDYNIEYLKRINYMIGIIASFTISIYYITKK